MSHMNIHIRERLKMESHLWHALEREELSLHYQPMIEVGSDRVFGAEALVRWDNPALGSVPPGDFVLIAEQAGLMAPIGEWVLRTACKEAAYWQGLSEQPLQISVNVSSAQFAEGDFVQTVVQSLEESGLSPDLLSLEITETLLIADTSVAVKVLQQLREIGVRVSVDDFGTGYSSPATMRHLPVDTLKIDRMLIQDVMTDPEAAYLFAGLVALARDLSLSVVAVGVETSEQLDYVRSLDCDLVQGFYFSKPLPATEFRSQLKRGVADGWIA